MTTPPASILVHGYNWDIATEDPEAKQYWAWRLFAPAPALGFRWHSAPSWGDAWRHGRAHPYHRAWDMAAEAGPRLRWVLLNRVTPPVDIICHSLGSRVVLEALATDQFLPVQRVLIFNGAETARGARTAAALQAGTAFYSVVVGADAILRWGGALFAPGAVYEPVIGLHGMTSPAKNWHDLRLGAAGDQPHRIGDHDWSWRNPANVLTWRAVLAGTVDRTLTALEAS